MDEQAMKQMGEEQSAIASQLLAENPALPHITAIIMASDRWSAQRHEASVRSGEITFDKAMLYIGSFGRLDSAVRLQEEGFATRDHLLDIFPKEWPSADPDDTDPRFVQVWLEAWRRNGNRPVYDRKPPKGKGLPRTKTLRVYRGQPAGAPIGLSWSLDPEIASRFAKGAWARTPVAGGEIITLDAPRSGVLAYLTGRGESEVILDPRTVERTT